INDRVYQPAMQDLANQLAEDSIGVLSGKFAALIAERPNPLDAAVARLASGVGPYRMGNYLPPVPGVPERLADRKLGPPVAAAGLLRGQAVIKLGRSSG